MSIFPLQSRLFYIVVKSKQFVLAYCVFRVAPLLMRFATELSRFFSFKNQALCIRSFFYS